MEIIPAIDLLEGNCVRLIQGDYDQVTKFNSDPIKQALLWEELGATRLHLVDLDAAKSGESLNNGVIQQIAQKTKIPIQLGGGVRTEKRVKELLNYGIDRVIIGTAAIENENMVKELAKKFPRKIVIGIDAKKGKVATRGWVEESLVDAKDLAKTFANSGIAAIISTDISTDGTLKGPNLNSLRDIASASEVPIIASGGIGSLSDIISLKSLEALGVKGVIVGRALYDNKFSLQEAIKVTSNFDLEDPPIQTSNRNC